MIWVESSRWKTSKSVERVKMSAKGHPPTLSTALRQEGEGSRTGGWDRWMDIWREGGREGGNGGGWKGGGKVETGAETGDQEKGEEWKRRREKTH